jgi:hypothetical protein
LSALLDPLRRAWAFVTDPGPDANDMDDRLHRTRERRQQATNATQRAEESLSRVRVIIETAGGVADVVGRWRQ